MKRYTHRQFLIICVIGLLALLHIFAHNNLISFIIFPVALAAVLPYTYASSLPLTLGLILFAELFTTLPPGVMTLVVIAPLLLRRFFPLTEVDITLRYFTLIATTIAIQIFIIVVAIFLSLRFQDEMTWKAVLGNFPWITAGISWLATSAVTYILAIAWRDITPPDTYTSPPKLRT